MAALGAFAIRPFGDEGRLAELIEQPIEVIDEPLASKQPVAETHEHDERQPHRAARAGPTGSKYVRHGAISPGWVPGKENAQTWRI